MPTDEATSSTGATARRKSKSPPKAQPPAAASDPTGPGTISDKKDPATADGGPASSHGPEAGIAAGYHAALTVASAALGSVAALMTSITFSTVLLGLLPHADDMWGLRAVVAVLRLIVIGVNLLRSRPSTPFAILASVSRLVCAVVVEASFVFSQPIFATIAGGPFRPGDATRQLLLRLTRASWLSTTEPSASPSFGSLVFAVALGLWALPLRKVPRGLLHGYPRLGVQLLARAGKDVAKATLYYRCLVGLLEYLTELPMLPALVALPTPVLMSRQEFSLFRWSFPSPLHLSLLITGDFLMTSSVSYAQPTIGAVGCVLVYAALFSAGVAPTPGFAVYMAAWFAYAGCDYIFASVSRGSAYWTLSSMAARLRVAPGGRRSSYADLEVRIWGWRKRIYRPFDTALFLAVAVAMVVAMPYETLELVLFGIDCLYQAGLFVYYGMSGTLDHGGTVYV